MFKALIVALAAVAAAIPTSPQPSGSDGNQCGNNGNLHCCNKEAVGQILPVDVLGSSCQPLTVIGGILQGKECNQQISCCSKVTQNGIINVACTPIQAL